jgi:hypothetical protein
MNKKYILSHIDDFNAQQLFDFIKQGFVTLQELKDTGNLDNSLRKAIVSLQTADEKVDDDAWEKARYGNETVLADYTTKFPAGKHVVEAKQKIDNLESQRRQIQAQKQDILDKIKRNPNSYSPNEIKTFLGNGTFTKSELENCGIPQSAIDNLDNIRTPQLQLGNTPTSIPDGYTEVYFWGGTGSGKTCALGAILQMAEQKGYLNIATGPGYLYANQLKNIFSNDGVANDYLPPPSPVETTQYLPFTLKNPKEKVSRSVSLIELSGEIFKCFLYKNAGQQLPTQSHEDTFNSLNTFLKSNNRKVHFFFIDYDRENKPDGSGLKQSDYLAAASTYFNNNAVFGKTTDAIYVVLTKSDLLLDENDKPVTGYDNRVDYAIKHLNEHNYKAFTNTLKDNCIKYSINAGKLTVEPFSLGKVYFKQICDFDGSAAANIVEILMERIAGTKKSILDFFND